MGAEDLMPVLHIHGTNDHLVLFKGDPKGPRLRFLSTEQNIKTVCDFNGCRNGRLRRRCPNRRTASR